MHAKDIDLNAIYRHCVNFFFFFANIDIFCKFKIKTYTITSTKLT